AAVRWSLGGARLRMGSNGRRASIPAVSRRASCANRGMVAIVEEVTTKAKLAVLGASSCRAVASAMITKANSPPGPSSSAVSMAAGFATRKLRARPTTRVALTTMRPTTAAATHNGSRASSRKSRVMPTVKKNTPSSRPLKGSIVASIALRNSVSASSKPATKAPSAMESRARLAEVGNHRGPDDDEQRGGDDRLARPCRGDQPEQRPQQQPANRNDQTDCQHRLGHRQREAGTNGAAPALTQDRYEQQDRHHRQVLRQQDRKAGTAGGGSKAPLIGEDLDDDGGRGERQAGADYGCSRRLVAGRQDDCAEHGGWQPAPRKARGGNPP